MSGVNGKSELAAEPPAEHIAMLLDLASRRLRRDLNRLADQLDTRYPQLRGSHFRLLQIIPAGGARITDLADMAAMTKQSLGEFVDHLEQHGYVESVRLPADRRVRLVRRTAAGDAAVADALRTIARLENHWRDELGERRYTTMRAALRELVEADVAALTRSGGAQADV
jgi:DNA-binding MarR family transcriptional regulator